MVPHGIHELKYRRYSSARNSSARRVSPQPDDERWRLLSPPHAHGPASNLGWKEDSPRLARMQVHTRNERTVEEKEESGREGKRMREREGESGRKGKGLGVFEDTLILGRASVSVPSLPLLPASLASVGASSRPSSYTGGTATHMRCSEASSRSPTPSALKGFAREATIRFEKIADSQ